MNTNDRVLIVDDDPSLLAALVRHLGERFTIVTTECGENALELIRTQAPFAVMLCDMRMPGMDGIEVLRRAMELSPETIRVMLTGNPDQRTAIDAINQGEVFRFLSKPASITALTAVINEALHRHNELSHFNDLERIAHFDALTGLPNRILLADRMRQTVVQCQRRSTATAVAYIDLDGFKEVNDTYGHAAGDILLATVAQRMQQALREGDTLARMGGDEFVALLIDLGSGGDCETILERLLQAAAEPVVFDTAVLKVSASIGVAIYPRDGQNAERLLEAADQAMYQAKRTGRNRYHLLASE